jgi:DNA replication protein DnaC
MSYIAGSSFSAATFAYQSSPEWVTARENLALVGPAGTGKSHLLTAPAIAAVEAAHKVRHFIAADIAKNLHRGLAGNSVGRSSTLCFRDGLLID